MTKPKPLPDQEKLKELLSYNPDTGFLHWKDSHEKVYQMSHPRGYIQIYFLGEVYMAHRIIYKLVYGIEPIQIDHINRVTDDNKLINLRAVDGTTNKRNGGKQQNNTSGANGVVWSKNAGKWKAQLWRNKNTVYLGYFDTVEEAKAARKKADEEYGFHPTHGDGNINQGV